MIIHVARETAPTRSGWAICQQLRENGTVTVRAVGIAAVDRAVKAIICARKWLIESGHDLYFQPHFEELGPETDVIVMQCRRTTCA